MHAADTKAGNYGLADTHIHLEKYEPEQIAAMLEEFRAVDGEFVVAVSMDLESARRTEALAERYPNLVRPAYGFHPEQPLPSAEDEEALFAWMQEQASLSVESPESKLPLSRMTAVGEVGLPYYTRLEANERGETLDEDGYVRLLERFIMFAAKHDLPVILHAVYEDADIACDLLERHRVKRAHFHWFKGSESTVNRMIANGYCISFTPDLLYEEEIRALARLYPTRLVMTETDGPWPFEGSFEGRTTHPSMTEAVCREWAKLHGLTQQDARRQLIENARLFYGRHSLDD
ncbi:TatD family hydrolase [Saccharibacillus endophyticus]|uniref:TatD-related deoxyribonuclease n=1 Tax=Saccharibacillus endophyticus TaxID=2060666 RepID=A0ABQ2A054_9BACL|nr:TatD family hydrolase [Saccharibacillus endophyticus]GGH82298.1 TatD-related deoxyribonuclease [Saccharibacillus endophyticus]